MDVDLPDLEGLLAVEEREVDLVVDAGFEGFVEGTGLIGGHEEDAGVVV